MAADLGLVDAEADLVGLLLVLLVRPPLPPLVGVEVAEEEGGAVVELELELEPELWYWLTTKLTMSSP